MLRGFCRWYAARGHGAEGTPLKLDGGQDLNCLLLGLFGADDSFLSPDQVAELEKALAEHGKTYEFHSYEGAGHAFFDVDRPAYRPEAAADGWRKIHDFYGRYLAS